MCSLFWLFPQLSFMLICCPILVANMYVLSTVGTIILSFTWRGLPFPEQLRRQMAPWTGMKLLISFSMAPLSRSVVCFTPHIYVALLDVFTKLWFSHHCWVDVDLKEGGVAFNVCVCGGGGGGVHFLFPSLKYGILWL